VTNLEILVCVTGALENMKSEIRELKSKYKVLADQAGIHDMAGLLTANISTKGRAKSAH
jgi:hypothetical protein